MIKVLKNIKEYIKIIFRLFKFINIRKVFLKIYKSKNFRTISKADYLKWIINNSTDYEKFCSKINDSIYKESLIFTEQLLLKAKKIEKNLPFKTGGGGNFTLLYFLTRWKKPLFVVETGVALGYTTESILSAMHCNKTGYLFSSEYPYPTIPNSIDYVGKLVSEKFKSRWELHLNGDANNLRNLKNSNKKIDIFHYDSEKWYVSKKNTFNLIKKNLSENAIILFDDIQDDDFFYYLVNSFDKFSNFKIFQFNKKYLGMIF